MYGEDWCSAVTVSRVRGAKKMNAGGGGWLYGVLLLLGFLTLVLALRVRVCQFPIGYVSRHM